MTKSRTESLIGRLRGLRRRKQVRRGFASEVVASRLKLVKRSK